jgi:diphthamide biosynthesis protein 3
MTYDEVEIEDMDWDEALQAFTYQCPCGDLFQITLVCSHFTDAADAVHVLDLSTPKGTGVQEELADGEEIAHCPSCSLTIRVIYNPEDFVPDLSSTGPPPTAVPAS